MHANTLRGDQPSSRFDVALCVVTYICLKTVLGLPVCTNKIYLIDFWSTVDCVTDCNTPESPWSRMLLSNAVNQGTVQSAQWRTPDKIDHNDKKLWGLGKKVSKHLQHPSLILQSNVHFQSLKVKHWWSPLQSINAAHLLFDICKVWILCSSLI